MIGITKSTKYRPGFYLLFVFAVGWCCAFIKNLFGQVLPETVIFIISFLESASPLVAALMLLRTYLSRNHNLLTFFFGNKKSIINYLVVAFLFLFQFLSFYLFRQSTGEKLVISSFFLTFAGQIFYGGGLEEGGWRGYLQAAFEREFSVLLSAFFVGLIWVFWHLPYIILSETLPGGGNLLIYIITALITGFTLTAIHKLTESVLLCILFHGWQNAIVMSMMTNMKSIGFIFMFLVLGVISVFLCIRQPGELKQSRRYSYSSHYK